MLIRQWALFLLLILIAGCASENRRPVDLNTYDYANELFANGLYGDAYDAYHYLAETYPKAPSAEKAQYNAAYTLVYYKNLDYDYAGAEHEFDVFLQRYPTSKLADQARSWLSVLKSFDQSKTQQLMGEVEVLSKKIQNLWTELEDRKADEEKLVKEKDSLLAKMEDLSKKADDLLKEKERLLSEKAAVTAERDGLLQDKINLQHRVFSLTEEKNNLILAKKKLEKSHRDLTKVDGRLETQRKKIKKEEASMNTSSAPR
ncbi:MAG TPA: outer membrane protein assembly factor BamD [Nitrospirota bacterium]|nr:outer membrane protein assembly factor BamD [Nitrospirota bacterium]